MLEELQLRNYAQNTIRHYLRAVEDFARRFNCSPDRLGPRHIREYQAELFEKRKLSANSIGQHLAALRFFYIKALRKAWNLAETPYPKKTRRLPTILSRGEVAQPLHVARTPGEQSIDCFHAESNPEIFWSNFGAI
jgi:integrase/recombinase XerD